jgi:ankyrin repeat protein
MVDNLVKKQVIQPLRKFIEKFISHEKNTSEVTVTSSGELFHIKGSDSIASISEGTLAQNVRSWDYKVTFKSCPTKLSLTQLLLQGDYTQAKELLKPDRSLIDSVLFEACFANNYELVQIMVDRVKLDEFAADVNIKNTYGKGLLHISASEGYFEMTNALIETRQDIDLNIQDNDLRTPLHLACQNKQTKVTQILLSHPLNLDQEDIFGNTALHYAFISNNSQIIEQLLEKGANKLKQNTKGELPEDLNFNFNFYNAGSGV